MSHLIPSRTGRSGDDPIFSLNREASARRERGERVVNATVGALLDDDGRLLVLPSAARAVREVDAAEWAAYAPIAGTPDFLNAVCDDLLGRAPALREVSVASATPGGSGALRHAIANFLEAGQAVLVPSYYWAPYRTLADELGRSIATFPMFGEDGGLNVDGLDRAVGEQIATQGRVLLFLNDPCNNPTGYSMRPAEWRWVVDVLRARAERSGAPITLLIDAAYAAYGVEEPWSSLETLTPLLGKVGLLFAWSASKTFTHYGLRVGALVACVPEEDDRKALDAALSYSSRGTWSNCNRGGLTAVTRLLRDPELAASCAAERERAKAILQARVAAFNAAAAPKGLRYPRYEGGFFVTVFHDDAAAKAAAMRERGVYVVPGDGSLRVALCSVAERDVPLLVDALA